MAKHRVVVCCWKHGHQTELAMNVKQERALAVKVDNLKSVCPVCRNEENGNQAIFIAEGESLFNPGKIYQCRNGHVTKINAFTNGTLHIAFGMEDFENIDGTPQEAKEMIDSKAISCHHVKENGRVCGCKIKAIDNSSLDYPNSHSIKTKTRLGDIWDKAGAEPVRPGAYGKDGHYQDSRTEQANRERLKGIRKQRNIEESRHPGKKIDKATTRKYKQRSKGEVNPERLNGPQ